jgi:hypothetical protein
VVPGAQQVEKLTKKTIRVVPTQTIPQGITALTAFDREEDFESNTKLMEDASSLVKTIEVTRATRSTKLNDIDIKKGQAIGFLDSKLRTAGDNPNDVARDIISKSDLDKFEVMSIYWGTETTQSQAKQLSAAISKQYPKLKVEMINGGQPHYDYIIGIE